MKQLVFIITFLISSQYAFSQEEKYADILLKSLEDLKQANSVSEVQSVVNTLERISDASGSDWIPAFHTAYAYLMLNFQMEKGDDKETAMDRAQTWLDNAESNLPNDDELGLSEIHALQAFIYLGRVAVKPMVRGMSYGSKIQDEVDEALSLHATNPRPDYVLGLYYRGMPSMFGGGMEAACPYFQRSIKLFDKYQPDNQLIPHWGRKDVEAMIEACENL